MLKKQNKRKQNLNVLVAEGDTVTTLPPVPVAIKETAPVLMKV